MFGLFDWLKIGTSFLAGALLTGFATYTLGRSQGFDAGYQKHIAEVAIADAQTELQRKGDDASLRSLSDYDLCVVGLRDGGVSDVSPCEQLRRLRQECPDSVRNSGAPCG